MHIDNYDQQQVIDLLTNAKNIAVIPSKVAGCDSFAAAVGLYYMLIAKTKDTGKTVKFVYDGEVPAQCGQLIPQKEISANLSQRDLLISIKYDDTTSTSVSYTTDNGVFVLKMGPISKDFDTTKIRAKITGFDFDLVITVGAQEFEDLGQIYTNLKTEIHNAKIINVDNSSNNKRYGVVNIIDAKTDTLGELIYKHASYWELIPNKQSAKALLTGITYRNNNQKVD